MCWIEITEEKIGRDFRMADLFSSRSGYTEKKHDPSPKSNACFAARELSQLTFS
jgi:hypothetical protein